MALVNCPDCGKQISAVAPTCISCGRPMSAAVPPRPVLSAPGPLTHEAVKKGVQRSKLRNDLGSGFALIGLPAAIVVGMIWGAGAGWVTAIVVLGLAAWITYG